MKGGDKYRFEIPLETVAPISSSTSAVLDAKKKGQPGRLLDGNQKRRDGRSLTQLRDIFIKTGVISAAAGSAYVEIGRTKLFCGVYGPKQSSSDYSDKAVVECDVRFATFALKNGRASFLPGTTEAELGLKVREAVEVSILTEKFPKSVIEINILVVESRGGVVGAAITASSLALLDAGIATYDIVTACNVSKIENSLVLDPEVGEEEECDQSGHVYLAYMPQVNQITQLSQTGVLSAPEVIAAVELCRSGCSLIHELAKNHFKETLLKKAEKRARELKEAEEADEKVDPIVNK